ncbi:MAG TPA: DedA family protein [Candidatus Saccharimonadia bacterium]|nr:DedA family protein [Candidatus Saccharimonadia bacterium]
MLNIAHIIQSHSHIISLLIIGAIIFTESGIPVGFFLPGDTLLFTAGFFASQHYLPILGLILVVIVAKILGSIVGFYIGDKAGRKLFNKPNSFLFRKDYLNSAEAFYKKHGGKTVALGQFLPVVRTFSPIVAGVGKMDYKKFMFYNLLGALVWSTLIPLFGFWLGHRVTNIDKYLIPIVIAATIFSFAPAAWHLFGQHRKKSKKTCN